MLELLTLIAAAFAGTIYTIWAVRWFAARAWGSAIANALVALLMYSAGLGHGLVVGSYSDTWLGAALPLLFILPALARLAELARAEHVELKERAAQVRLAAYIRRSEHGG